MAYQGINTGTGANTDTGDTLIVGAEKINSNFIELYAAVGLGSTPAAGIVTSITAGSDIGINTSTGNVTISYIGAANTSRINADSLVVTGVSTLTSVQVPDDLTVGNSLVDTLTINAAIGSTLIPFGNQSFDLGSSSINWRDGYFRNLYGDGSNLTGISGGGGIGTTGSVNTTGIITASAFVGDGSGLTGIAHTTDITRTFLDFDGSQTTQAIRASGASGKKFAIEVGTSKTEAVIVGRFEPGKLTLPSSDLALRNVVGTGGTFNGTTNFNTANVGILTGAREGLVYKLSAGTGLTFEGSIHSHIGGTVGNEWHSSVGTLGIDATVLQTTGSQIILGDKTYQGSTTNNKSLQTLESVNALGFTTTTITAGTGITVTGSTGNVTISAVGSASTANVSTNTLSVGAASTFASQANFSSGINVTGVATATLFVGTQYLGNAVNMTGIVTSLVAGTGINVSGSTGNVTISAVGTADTANVSTNTLNVVGVTTTGTVFVTGETSGGSTTDYTEVTISGTTGFDNTYAAQSSGFTLDGGTVASGSATFNSNSNYLYYVATSGPQADGRIIIFSEVDNAWFALVVIGANFTEGNVSNDQALGFAAGAESLTTSTEVGDGKNVPQSSADIVYTTSGGGTTTGVGVTIRTDGDAIFAGVVTATSFRGDGSQLTGVGGGNTANVSTNTLNVIGVTTASDVNITGIVTAGIGTIRSLRVGAGAGPSAPNGQLAVVNATGVAAFTVGQNVDGSGQNHLGIYYNGPAAPIASQIFTSNGIMRFVTDGGGGGALPLIQQSGFQFGVNGNFSNTPLVSIHDVTPATGVSTALVVNGQTLLNGGVNVSGITTLGVTTIGGNLTYSGNDLTFDGSNQQAFFPSDSAFGLEMRTTASPFLVFDTRSTTPFIVCQQAVSFALNSTTPTMTNSTMTIQLNSDTELQFTVKGSDGVNRTATLTLS